MTSSRTPEWPRARLAAFSASIRRTTGGASGSPTPTRVRADQVELQRVELVFADACRRQLAEAGVDAVDRGAALGGPLHDGGAGADGGLGAASRASGWPPAWRACRSSRVSWPGCSVLLVMVCAAVARVFFLCEETASGCRPDSRPSFLCLARASRKERRPWLASRPRSDCSDGARPLQVGRTRAARAPPPAQADAHGDPALAYALAGRPRSSATSGEVR